jgi:hypothetical protein
MSLIGHSDPEPLRERLGGGKDATCETCGRSWSTGWALALGVQHARLYRHEVVCHSSATYRLKPAVPSDAK